MGVKESCRISVASTGSILCLRRIAFNEVLLVSAFNPTSVFSYLHYCNLAELGNLVKGLFRIVQLGKSLGLGLVGKHNIHIPLHYVVEKSQIGLHYII